MLRIVIWHPFLKMWKTHRTFWKKATFIIIQKLLSWLLYKRPMTKSKDTWNSLTHDMAMIQPLFPSSKWNLGKNFGLKFHLSYLHTPQRFFWNSTMRKEGHFCYCRTYLPPFYVVEWIRRKWLPHVAISKIYFLDHFSPSFLSQKW